MNSTKKAILDAAVVQFAEKGFDGAALREISREAKVNAAATHYYFDSKEAVYSEVIQTYLAPLCEERLVKLRELDNKPNGKLSGQPRIAALIRGYIAPHLRLCGIASNQAYIRLLARFSSEPRALTQKIYTQLLEPVRTQYLTALCEAAPHLSADEVKRLFGFVVTLMATSPLDVSYEDLSGKVSWPTDPEDLIDRIVAFTSEGFLAATKQVGQKACSKTGGSAANRRR